VLEARPQQSVVDEQTIELIAQRVIAAIREDLDAIAHGLSAPVVTEQLTVGQVARQLGVARSTVYAHWREWGGYKLGTGDKAPIRFDSAALPIAAHEPKPRPSRRSTTQPGSIRIRRRGNRPGLIGDAPRLAAPQETIA
jgi:transposase-like protein